MGSTRRDVRRKRPDRRLGRYRPAVVTAVGRIVFTYISERKVCELASPVSILDLQQDFLLTDNTILLLVEDEALILNDLELALADAGYTVITAMSGAEAIATLDDSGNPLAGIITDIRIGDEIDGWAVARHARGLAPLIPVVYMSGDSAADWPSKGVPNSAILQKPFAAAQLVTAISHLMNEAVKVAAR